MPDSETLEQRIQNALPSFSPKQKRLARFILDNRYFVSVASAHDVGQKVGVSAATVVRLAQRLGYNGFTELQEDLRARFPRYLTMVERGRQRLAELPATDGLVERAFHTDVDNLHETLQNLSQERLHAAVNAIQAAQQILIVGGGLSAAPVMYFAHSLRAMGFNARAAAGGGVDVAAEVAQLNGDTLVIAVDVWRYLRATVYAMSTARERGLRTIAITDSLMSPLAQLAEHVFVVATNGVAHNLSPTAIFALINAFLAVLSSRLPDQTLEALQRLDEAYRQTHLLIVEG